MNVTDVEEGDTRVIYTPVNSISVTDLIPGGFYRASVFAVDEKERATDSGSAPVTIQTSTLLH